MRVPTSFATFAAAALLAGCAASPGDSLDPAPTPADDRSADAAAFVGSSADFGLLVMAHGGDEAWNASVQAEVDELRGVLPVELAFGMANPMTLEPAIEALEARGVERAAVIRLFLSGASFREQTDWFLGMADTPPENFVLMGHGGGHHTPSREAIEHDLEFATHDHGLLDTDLARDILVDRALTLSEDAGRESVILVAHGMGDDADNAAVLADLERVADAIRDHGFARVEAATLREDWPDERPAEEAAIRAFVADETDAGRRVLVLPARLSGFGPYAEVLEGLDYVAGEGLLPHPSLSDWILRTGARLGCSRGWVDAEACER